MEPKERNLRDNTMRKISEMYKRSGGASYQNTCQECKNLREEKNGSRTTYKCSLYDYKMDSHESDWKPDYIACKFFNMSWEEAYPETIKGQMTIQDYPELLP